MSRPARPAFRPDANSAELLAGITRPGLVYVDPRKVRVQQDFNPRGRTGGDDAFREILVSSIERG